MIVWFAHLLAQEPSFGRWVPDCTVQAHTAALTGDMCSVQCSVRSSLEDRKGERDGYQYCAPRPHLHFHLVIGFACKLNPSASVKVPRLKPLTGQTRCTSGAIRSTRSCLALTLALATFPLVATGKGDKIALPPQTGAYLATALPLPAWVVSRPAQLTPRRLTQTPEMHRNQSCCTK